jgi:hypothetical protein
MNNAEKEINDRNFRAHLIEKGHTEEYITEWFKKLEAKRAERARQG